MMLLGRSYMHKKFSDVYFQIIDNSKWPQVLVRIMNLGYTGEPWEIQKFYDCTIKDPENWVDITEVQNNKRTNRGLP